MHNTEKVDADSTVSLREITEETVVTVCRLSDTLSPLQKKMVAPNAQSIAQAHFSEHAWFRAIYADEKPVGSSCSTRIRMNPNIFYGGS
jgi:diamine N-acetyltransferase